MEEITKRIVTTTPLQLDLFTSTGRIRFSAVIRSNGGRFLIAGTVALLCGLLIHIHLTAVLIPCSTILFAMGVMAIRKQKRRGVDRPLLKISLAQGLDVWRCPNLSKYKQKTLDL